VILHELTGLDRLSTRNSGKEDCASALQVWVVSQKEKRQEQVQIHVGVDAYDAFCLLLRTPVLIVSYASTFSQAAALVAPDTSPHYRFQGRMD